MSERNLVARLEAWAAWCHKRNLKAELQADIYAAAEEVERLQSVLRNIYTYNATGNYEVDYFLMKNMADRALKSLVPSEPNNVNDSKDARGNHKSAR
jgi:hypothetical protein